MTSNRRDILERASATAVISTVGLAGATTVGAHPRPRPAVDDGLPEYSRWLTLDTGDLEFVSVDWETVGEYVEDELEQAQTEDDPELPAEFEADPMIAPVSEGMISMYFFIGLTLAPYGLGRLLDETTFESTPQDLVLTDATFVATGIDAAEIDAQLTQETGIEFIRQFERTDEIGEYDVYTSVEDVEEDDVMIAVGDEALVVADSMAVDASDDSMAILETAIGASDGEIDRATDESESFEWLVETGGHGDVTVGQHGDPVEDDVFVDLDFEGLEDAEGIVSSLTVEDETTSTGDFVAIIDNPDEDALEDFVGASGEDQSVSVDGDRVTATATWREETVTGTQSLQFLK
ncbi:hypothetical protein [Halostagnicola sp. A-GB9-2]|uniref:hypothetical protein n=1 Tax=Halostagnicola sp. A-GB9-2 TaxID=3048066 RepID=UPI0024C002E5|nr:hypothetical protein [Halostagnicola sp. A-GB9-2]MDJ1434597.1 hypothetical protein [Halostagnicola sp. A-GB9-2]